MKEFSLGEAAPFKNEVGDMITSLSLPYFAVPVFGQIVKPLLIRFGSLIAPDRSTPSFPCDFSSSSSFFLFSFSSFDFLLVWKPERSFSLSESESEFEIFFSSIYFLFIAYFKSPY
jgi:hypothetical protein